MMLDSSFEVRNVHLKGMEYYTGSIGVVPVLYLCSTQTTFIECWCCSGVVLTDRSKYMYCKFLDFDILLCALNIQKQNCGIGNAQREIL